MEIQLFKGFFKMLLVASYALHRFSFFSSQQQIKVAMTNNAVSIAIVP